MAVWGAAHGHPPPWALVKVWLCQFYHCLPSELADEPADDLIQGWRLHQLYLKNQPKPGK